MSGTLLIGNYMGSEVCLFLCTDHLPLGEAREFVQPSYWGGMRRGKLQLLMNRHMICH